MVRVLRFLAVCVICMFCKSLFVLLSFFFWSLCCLFFFDLRILITLWYLQTLLVTDCINVYSSTMPFSIYIIYLLTAGIILIKGKFIDETLSYAIIISSNKFKKKCAYIHFYSDFLGSAVLINFT
jgi:hypothetical protein